MHDIYLKTTRVIHNRNNFDFLSFHAASTNFDRGFQKCITKNKNLSALFSSKKLWLFSVTIWKSVVLKVSYREHINKKWISSSVSERSHILHKRSSTR